MLFGRRRVHGFPLGFLGVASSKGDIGEAGGSADCSVFGPGADIGVDADIAG